MKWSKLIKSFETYGGIRAVAHAKRNGGFFLRNLCRIGTGPGNVRLGVAARLTRKTVEPTAV
ncbi:hypothetical protein [Ralstonia wenshanensis]|uniref:hypothetical protein n=1 Tax=Ralstonia wenshanensis TaxID=2842456 RepID=UPI0039C67973